MERINIEQRVVHSAFTKIQSGPTYESLRQLQVEINANYAAIPSHRGGGAMGLLGMVLPTDVYRTLAGVDFEEPTPPPLAPNYGHNPSRETIAVLDRQFQIDCVEWETINSCEAYNKRLLIEAVDATYLAELNNPITSFADVTCFDMLSHLFDRYGTLDPQDVENQHQLLRELFTPETRMEDWILKVENVVGLLQVAGVGVTNAQLIVTVYTVMENSDLFESACEAWLDKDLTTQTWPNFKTHFLKANAKRLKKINKKKRGTLYEHANQATASNASSKTPSLSQSSDNSSQTSNPVPPNVPSSSDTPQEDASDITYPTQSLALLATATASDRTTVANLSGTIASQAAAYADLLQQNASKDMQIAALMQHIQSLTMQHTPLSTASFFQSHTNQAGGRGNAQRGRGHGGGRNRSTGRQGGGGRRNARTSRFNQWCWTHGMCRHGSAECRSPAPGHKPTATLENRMGGSEYGI